MPGPRRAPTAKYQNEGGPSPERIIGLLETHAEFGRTTAVDSFVDALAFNWIIAGTDAHAKNYSVLLSGGQVRLAPLYDVASALPYDDMYLPKLKMAMRIGGEYSVTKVEGRHWVRLAEATGLEATRILARIDEMASRIPAAFAEVADSAPVVAIHSQLPGRLLDLVRARAVSCRASLAR